MRPQARTSSPSSSSRLGPRPIPGRRDERQAKRVRLSSQEPHMSSPRHGQVQTQSTATAWQTIAPMDTYTHAQLYIKTYILACVRCQ